ncbi:hypothetical protein HOLleu_36252 [Holothuria leucospilota]|uniref:ZU5 domain-containing protein n=1 Tax=Holothuria leucospilota TaxID=206669 RepID=A0A9Q0YLV8_HOLLE|nr:hypothetical protein HOLleu_36252 [Holothuria leucospilota]
MPQKPLTVPPNSCLAETDPGSEDSTVHMPSHTTFFVTMDTNYATCPKFHCFVFIRSVQHIQHERFTTKQHGYRLWYLSLDLSGNIAVSGYHSSDRTYIDLYSGNNSDSRDKLKLFYSKEFEKYSLYMNRYVSFLDKNVSKLVTCIGDKIEIIDTKNESKVLRSCRVNGETTCLAVREGEIFIGLWESQTVLVFNNDLKETKKIRIQGIKDGDWPCDLQVIKDTVFVCTAGMLQWRALSLSVYDGSIVSEYTDTTAMYERAWRIAVSEEMNLVAVVWLGYPKRRIIVYSLNKNKSFLVFDVDNDVTRIRISDRDRMIITGNKKTGEIQMYSLRRKTRGSCPLTGGGRSILTLNFFLGLKPPEQHLLLKPTSHAYGWKRIKLTHWYGRVLVTFLVLSIKFTVLHTLKDWLNRTGPTWELRRRDHGYSCASLSFSNEMIMLTMSSGLCHMFSECNCMRGTRISQASHFPSGGPIPINFKEQLFSFEAMKKTLACLVSPEECEELRKYFGVIEEEIQRRLESTPDETRRSFTFLRAMSSSGKRKNTAKRMECLLTIIEEKGHLSPYNISTVVDAVSTLGDDTRISNLKGPMEGYSLHGKNTKIIRTEMMTRQQAWEDERNQLSSKLETAESRVKEHEKTPDDQQDQLVQAQEQEKMLREDIKDGELKIKDLKGERMTLLVELQQMKTLTVELEQTQMKSSEEIETLTEELKQTKQSKTESDRQVETLREELKQTMQSKKESDGRMEILTEELKQSKAESGRQIQTITEELKQTKQSKTKSDRQIKALTGELKQVKRESHKKIETLTVELNETKQRLLTRNKEIETTNKDLELTKQTLKETTHDRDYTRTELKQYQLDFAKESKALKEVLNQAKEAMAELHKRPVEDKPVVDSKETGDEYGVILAAEFGRLTVAIAEHLRLDDCLRLARFCNIPASDCDTVLRLSLIESPGMKLFDVLKKRKVINMFDVTNLQKALAMLQLEAVNHDLVAPYQEKINKEQYELYKVEEMYTWEEIDAFVNAAKDLSAQRQIRDSQTSLIDDTEPEYASQTEATAQHTEAGDEGRRSFLGGRHHQLYTEHSISREGGTIQLANVSLTVPPDALHESHVIALSVINESPSPLDREVDTARMTPLIKLEPLGLMFKKSLQLNIPHSALISEPENHDVIIYSGQIEDSSDSIRWTKERSIPRQLKEKSVTVDIQCLTYISASLVSQTSAPPLFIVRAVPFVDGVRNTDDDITLTICFCSDNDSEYNMLLSDYHTKLPLEQYSTLQLHRQSERDEDDAGFLSVTFTSVNNTYVPDTDQAVKQFSISHLCTASRVSHQLRLQKNKDIDKDDVQVLLTFSQAESTSTKILMKARIKDLMISQESEDFLLGPASTALKPYGELKANISSMLEKHHCIQLATYFDLTPAEAERVQLDASPGRILMKILDERENIMPQKMGGLYQGLKVCQLDKIVRLVFQYIEKNSNETHQEKHENEKDKCVKGIPGNASVSRRPLEKWQKTSRASLSDQSMQTTLSSSCVSSDVHVKTLTNEGYTEHEVVKALDISRNRLVMARKVLQVLREQSEIKLFELCLLTGKDN